MRSKIYSNKSLRFYYKRCRLFNITISKIKYKLVYYLLTAEVLLSNPKTTGTDL